MIWFIRTTYQGGIDETQTQHFYEKSEKALPNLGSAAPSKEC